MGSLFGNKNNESFQIQPPKVDYGPAVIEGELKKQMMFDNVNAPQLLDEAWMRYIIEFHVPDISKDEKNLILGMLKPLTDLAPKSNIRRREITMHLISYDLIWDKYFIYMKKGKYDPRLLVLEDVFREAIELQLNRSVDGWLGRLMHTKLFRIFTSDDQGKLEKGMRFFGKKNKGNQEM
jgi:hypothetical protein